MIGRGSSLRDVAFEVSTALSNSGLPVVLVGGSAATFYAPEVYQSVDVDFVARFAVDRPREQMLVEVLEGLGYQLDGNTFVHRGGSPFTVEFPTGPPAIADSLVTEFETVHKDNLILTVYTPTDSVRDRLCHYFYWNDRTALNAAVGVARAQRDRVDLTSIQTWATRLAEHDRVEHPEMGENLERFLDLCRTQ